LYTCCHVTYIFHYVFSHSTSISPCYVKNRISPLVATFFACYFKVSNNLVNKTNLVHYLVLVRIYCAPSCLQDYTGMHREQYIKLTNKQQNFTAGTRCLHTVYCFFLTRVLCIGTKVLLKHPFFFKMYTYFEHQIAAH